MNPNENLSEFNSSLAKLQRIDAIIRNIIQARAMKDVFLWYDMLDCFASEMYPYIKDDKKKKEIEKKLMSLNTMIYRNEAANRKTGRNMISFPLKTQMTTLENELRQGYADAGFEMKFRDDPRFAI